MVFLFYKTRKQQLIIGMYDYPRIGKILKLHGYKGHVLVEISAIDVDDCLDMDELFINIDGLKIPYPVLEMDVIDDGLIKVLFKFAENQDTAKQFIGCYVHADTTGVETVEPAESLVGYSVFDKRYGDLGKVQRMENYKGNLIVELGQLGDTNLRLVSLHDDLVERISAEERKLYTKLPDGYFEVI